MLSDEFLNCCFEDSPISDFSKRLHTIKCDKMKSGDVFPCKKLNDYDNDDSDKDDIMIIDPCFLKEESFGRKRKQEPVSRLLNWLKDVAKNPCHSSVSSLPEKSKWKSYGNEEIWKQVLLVRETMFVKRHADSSSEQAFLQRNQKMHPCLYENDSAPIYNLRERLKLEKKVLPLESLSKPTALNNSSHGCSDSPEDDYKPVPLGPNHQAQLPEWNSGDFDVTDCKWFGTREWPLKKSTNRFLLERDPIGKGRQDSCGCPESGSSDCVKFHISEKRHKIKLELGTAFYRWKFDKMGEDVKLSWTSKNEKMFENIVSLNPPSLGKCFWDEIIEEFPSRTRTDLVSYYYNVFLLRRRGHQNRVTPEDIDSDDDSESGIAVNGVGKEVHKTPGSILYSPKKRR